MQVDSVNLGFGALPSQTSSVAIFGARPVSDGGALPRTATLLPE
jgi:hypothetical protein